MDLEGLDFIQFLIQLQYFLNIISQFYNIKNNKYLHIHYLKFNILRQKNKLHQKIILNIIV